MSFEIRPIGEDEYDALHAVVRTAFGGSDEPEEREDALRVFEFDRSVGVFDGPTVVGSAAAYSFDLTLPGPTTMPVAGVTWVGVLPTYRRRGILRSMMEHQLDDIAQRGEAVAILTASETLIYGRYGYGLASSKASVAIDPRHGAMAPEVPRSGTLRLLDREESGKVVPDLYDRWRRVQPGAITRRPEWWEVWLQDRSRHEKADSGDRYCVVHETPAGADGYVTYRVKQRWTEHGLPGSELRVNELVTLDPEARAALWRYCFEVDLVSNVVGWGLPVDEPLRWRLVDPRRLLVTGVMDMLWVRVLDVPAALAARRYARQDRLVLDVTDGFRPATSGRYELEGGPGEATCRRTDRDADLTLGIADLGAAYLGGVPFSTLAAAGRVTEVTPGALARADAMFTSTPLPYCNTGF